MNSKPFLDAICKRIVEAYRKAYGNAVEGIFLYGSYARGDYDDESDIDVMIMADIPMEDVLKYSGKICDFVSDINVDNSVFISPMIQSEAVFNKYKNVTPFYQNVAREGVRLYG